MRCKLIFAAFWRIYDFNSLAAMVLGFALGLGACFLSAIFINVLDQKFGFHWSYVLLLSPSIAVLAFVVPLFSEWLWVRSIYKAHKISGTPITNKIRKATDV